MDLWLLFLKLMKVPTPNFALVGRWAGHGMTGKWAHVSIAAATSYARRSGAGGWLVYNGVGMAFAGLLVAIAGTTWIRHLTLPAAMAVRIGSVVAPLFVMQPAMGAGIASSRMAASSRNCLRSLINHAVFDGGLYGAALSSRRSRNELR